MKYFRQRKLNRVEKRLGYLTTVYDFVRRLDVQGIPYSGANKQQVADEIRKLEAQRYELQKELNV